MKRILYVRAFVNINEAAQAACGGDFKLADLNYPWDVDGLKKMP